MADRLVNGKRLLLYTRRISLGKASGIFYLPWKILESPELLGVENSPLSISLVLYFCLWLRENKNLQSTFFTSYKSSVGGILQSVLI